MRGAPLTLAYLLLIGLAMPANAQTASPRFLVATSDTSFPSVEVTPSGFPSAYQRKITLHLGRVSRREALLRIGAASGLQFVYANDLIASEDTVHLDVLSLSVADVLRKVLQEAEVDVVVSSHRNAVLVRQRKAPPGRSVIRGVVFDSIVGRPIVGAVVQVAVSNPSRLPWTTTTDSAGMYRVEGLPAGRYTVGFYHDVLMALGLESSTRSGEPARDATVTADLALPSIGAVVALRCGTRANRTDRGMLVGVMRGASSNAAVAGAELRVSWGAIALDSGAARVVEEEALASVEPDGAYLVCGLPLDAPLDLRVRAQGFRAITGPVVRLPRSGVEHLDLLLADSTARNGAGTLHVQVNSLSGRPVASGRAILAELGREASIRDGAFALRDLPGGSWIVETRVIGTEPRATLVTVVDSADNRATITVDNEVQRLDAVTVIGKMDRNTRVLEDVLRRRRHYAGTFFLPGSDAVKRASFTSDLLKEARGFTYRGRNIILARGRRNCVALYVDDAFEPQALDVLDEAVPLKNLLAVETYPSIELAPVQFRFAFGRPDPNNPLERVAACAVVVAWTKRDY
ncbi:MAG: carboxypeptidase-like regulatory domain-containing protein [Gemmatimonadaceae bacterium]